MPEQKLHYLFLCLCSRSIIAKFISANWVKEYVISQKKLTQKKHKTSLILKGMGAAELSQLHDWNTLANSLQGAELREGPGQAVKISIPAV